MCARRNNLFQQNYTRTAIPVEEKIKIGFFCPHNNLERYAESTQHLIVSALSKWCGRYGFSFGTETLVILMS